MWPLISIVVPVYNGEKTIALCIESLLRQDYPKDRYEIIVIDNNSNDRTAEIVKQYPVIYLFEDKAQNPSVARNAGIKAARGEIIAFIDADCIASPNWLREGVKLFKSKIIGCVAGEIKAAALDTIIEKCFEAAWPFSAKEKLQNFYFLPTVITANAFYRKAVFNEIGLFDENTISGEDLDLCWRMQLFTSYKVGYNPAALVFHKHRTTFRDIFKQHMVYGYGVVYLEKKYKNYLISSSFYKKLYWSFIHFAKDLKELLYCIGHYKEKYKVVIKLISLTRCVGGTVGELKAFSHLLTGKLKVQNLPK